VHPHTIDVVRTYARGRGLVVRVVSPAEASLVSDDVRTLAFALRLKKWATKAPPETRRESSWWCAPRR